MAATPKNGTMIFRGLQSGQSYIRGFYNPDVAGSSITFDGGAGAGASSPNFITFPENVALVDVAVVSGIVDTTQVRLTSNSIPSVQLLRWTTHLESLNMRPVLNIQVAAGNRFSGICVA